MPRNEAEWEFVYILPNLIIRTDGGDGPDAGDWPDGIDLDADVVVMASGEDERVRAIRGESPACDQICRAFRDEFGEAYSPAIILVRKGVPDRLRTSANAFNDFRNAVAMSILLMGRAAHARGGGSLDPSWSDTFDFHPAQVNPHGRAILQSPALLHLLGDGELNFTPSPYVSTFNQRLVRDQYLYRAFGREWKRRYLGSCVDDRFGRTLFRSLEAAYIATSVGAKTLGSIHEYGAQIALWVSAIEILAWPSKRRANIETVTELLGRVDLPDALARKRYRVRIKGVRQSINALQHAYVLLYNARNQFLHGEPVAGKTLLRRKARREVALPRLAALVYREALVGYLDKQHRKALTVRTLGDRALEMMDDSGYERALEEALLLSDRGD